MGTNYDAHINCCDKCERPEYVLHIGKSSAGWTFSFRGYRNYYVNETTELNIDTWRKWQLFLKQPNVKIYNEYGEVISYDDFYNIVEQKKNEPFNHAKLTLEKSDKIFYKPEFVSEEYIKQNWIDEDGNSFSDTEFC